MAQVFGKTWWGKQWLQSLSHIDNSNRLPRGATYARKGSVTEITINGNVISAKVRGSRPTPYKVQITVPMFAPEKINIFIKELTYQPFVLSKLFNRELDPTLLDIAKQVGVTVFPKKWSDFDMKCSCPDYAVPCKHLAAVIYKVSEEIDNNPFVVFELHHFDIINELQKQDIKVDTSSTEVTHYTDLFYTDKKTGKSAIEPRPLPIKQKISYSKLKPLKEALMRLLHDNPVFYTLSGDFKGKYNTHLSRVVRVGQRIVQGKVGLASALEVTGTTPPLLTMYSQVEIRWTEGLKCEVLLDGKEIIISHLMIGLETLSLEKLNNYQLSVVGVHDMMYMALHLVANGVIVPQIVKHATGYYCVRWLPSLISKEVREMVQQLKEVFPLDVFTVDKLPKKYVNEDELVVNALSVFLTEIVGCSAGKSTDDLFVNMFFFQDRYDFNKPGENALAGGINTWLQKYYIHQSNISPQVVVKELDDDTFSVDINISDRRDNSLVNVGLKDVLTLSEYDGVRLEVLQTMTTLSEYVRGLEGYITSKGVNSVTFDNEAFTLFLFEIIPVIQLLDIDVLLPKSLQQILKPKVSVKVSAKGGKSYLQMNEILSFEWQVAIGDNFMSEGEFNKLMVKSNTLLKYKSNYIYVGKEEIQKLYKHFTNPKDLSGLELLRIALSGQYDGAELNLDEEVKTLLKKLTTISPLELPVGLNATLRPYQQRGYEWLYHNAQLGLGSVLADDMGLGKTLQVITTLLKYKEEGALEKQKVLVVAPTGLLTNWKSEIEKFAPSLVASLYHGASRALDLDSDVVLTSYGLARGDHKVFKKHLWHSVIIDEAQNIKNSDSGQTKAVKGIKANNYIALSGTPVENRLSELWSIMDYCNAGFLGTIKVFKDSFSSAIELYNDVEVANKLKRTIGPFMMRRLKTDKTIISDLPDKIEMNAYSTLTASQASLYESTLNAAMKALNEVDENDKSALFKRQGLVLQMILALKQICNHPTQFLKNKVVDPSLSGKVELLFDKLDSILDCGEKVLIFTQFKEMGLLLQQFIEDRYKQEAMFYHGGSSVKQRNEMVDNFQNSPAHKIFILSLKAAGTGLNLTAANHVIHYDLWWNPAVEAQATDRAYRIGQKSNVMVHRFITKNTFEEQIDMMIQSKKALADMTVSTGENWIGNLSNSEIKELFVLR